MCTHTHTRHKRDSGDGLQGLRARHESRPQALTGFGLSQVERQNSACPEAGAAPGTPERASHREPKTKGWVTVLRVKHAFISELTPLVSCRSLSLKPLIDQRLIKKRGSPLAPCSWVVVLLSEKRQQQPQVVTGCHSHGPHGSEIQPAVPGFSSPLITRFLREKRSFSVFVFLICLISHPALTSCVSLKAPRTAGARAQMHTGSQSPTR